MSETAQNVLNTILFHTGEQSSRFMLVLATNRPHELDEALLDRMDVVLQVIYRRRNVVRFVLAGRVYLFPRVAIPPLGAIAYAPPEESALPPVLRHVLARTPPSPSGAVSSPSTAYVLISEISLFFRLER